MARLLLKHWFLLALGCCIALGYGFSEVVEPIARVNFFRSSVVFAVMWMMGVTLRPDAVRRSVMRPLPSLLAIAVNIFLVPMVCLPLWWILSPSAFGGLFVAALVPGTLASASVWTREAGGDDSIAMMNTVVTNLACVAVVPVGVALVLTRQTSVSPTDQMIKLAGLVVLPLIIAQLMRMKIGDWADRNKKRISTIAQVGILVMVMMGSATSTRFIAEGAGGWWSQIPLLLLTASLHTIVLLLGVTLAARLRLSPEQQIAIGISGSQKTLMVGLEVAIDCGVSVLPMLMYHLSQLVVDTVVASRWSAKYSGHVVDSADATANDRSVQDVEE